MARARSPDIDKAFKIYKKHNGNIELVKIAEILGVSSNTIRTWKNRYKWNESIETFQKGECNVSIKKDKNLSWNKNERNTIEKEVKEVLENVELTDKQRLFCLYYIKCFNATRAYHKAYECNYNVANAEGYKMLVNPCIKKEIRKLKEYKMNSRFIGEEDILQEYINIAFSEEDQDKIKALDFLSKYYGLLNNKDKDHLDIERKRLENDKLKAEISRITGDADINADEDDGFINALNGTAQGDWEDGKE